MTVLRILRTRPTVFPALAALFVLAASPSHAQETKTISGTIKDSLGAVLPGVSVVLKAKDCDCKKCIKPCAECCPESRTTADSSGRFSFKVPAGENELTRKYELTLEFAGFAKQVKTVEVGASGKSGIEIALKDK